MALQQCYHAPSLCLCVAAGVVDHLDPDARGLPADWAGEGRDFAWQPVQAPPIFHTWRHVPGAQWVWSHAEWHDPAHRERLIVRLEFEIPEDLRVIEAQLLVCVDDAVVHCLVN